MKILFDHQIFSSQVFGGVSKYFAEIISRMPKDSWMTSAWLSNNEYAKYHHLFRMTTFFPNWKFRGKNRLMVEIGKPYSNYIMKKGNYDVVHQTNFDTYLIKSIGTKPMVTTYHDVNFLTEQNYNKRMIKLQTESLNRADAVIAISENTKSDMLKYFDIDANKIKVIYHGIDAPIIPVGLEGRIVESPYILYVGMRHLFKNFGNFIKAFGSIASKYPGLKVVCTREDFNNTEYELFKNLGIEDRMQVIKADEITLNRLYRDALFFVFPSKYEGFGMPILEAMSNGCPTVISDASCFPEIAGDASLYFAPDDIDSIANSLTTAIENEGLRDSLRSKGFVRALQFSWQKSADAHLNLYKTLIG